MAGLVYPFDFENDTPADGEEVQQQFDAVKDFLADLNIDSGGIPYSSIDFNNNIVAGDIAADAITAEEIATPGITSADSAGVASAGLGVPVTIAQATAPANGTYFIAAEAQYTRTGAASGDAYATVELAANLSSLGQKTLQVQVSGGNIAFPFAFFRFANLSYNDVITMNGWSGQSGNFTASSYIRMLRFA